MQIGNPYAKGSTDSIYDKICGVCRYQGDCHKLNYIRGVGCDLLQELTSVMYSLKNNIPIDESRKVTEDIVNKLDK